MCFGNPLGFLQPKMPRLTAAPAAPTADSASVRQRELEEQKLLEGRTGTAGTVKTDLSPADVAGQRRVLLGV